jgi:hypothetical protein
MTSARANLNPILARWIGESPAQASRTWETAELDCLACTKKLKCCDFQPFVAGFLLGAVLEEGGTLPDSPNIVYQPLGLMPTRAYREKHGRTPEAERGEDLLCALYDRDSRRCSIWDKRPGECSTYLCTTPVPPARQQLSQDAFAVEAAVSQMALAHLGFSRDEIFRQVDILNGAADDLLEPPRDRERMMEIYRAAWAWARGLTRADVISWMK